MPVILGLSGSLRQNSYNTALLKAAQSLMPEGYELVIKTMHDIPLYDGDLEDNEGIPATVLTLGEAISYADGLIICTPEYNGSMPGPLKNCIDWLSRIDEENMTVFDGKPTALMGATPGRLGTNLSQAAWTIVFRSLGVLPWNGGRMMVSEAHKLLNDSHQISDERTLASLKKFLAGFVSFAQAQRSLPH